MQQQTKREVLTLWKDCKWSKSTNYDPNEVMKGYHSLNLAAREIAHYGIVHSVSFSQLVIPPMEVIRLFSTIVYSGNVPLDMFGPNSPYETVRGEVSWSGSSL